jgi:hypothetical protein
VTRSGKCIQTKLGLRRGCQAILLVNYCEQCGETLVLLCIIAIYNHINGEEVVGSARELSSDRGNEVCQTKKQEE